MLLLLKVVTLLVVLNISLAFEFHGNFNFSASNVVSIPGPIIITQDGPVQGREEFYDGVNSVYTYKGIR